MSRLSALREDPQGSEGFCPDAVEPRRSGGGGPRLGLALGGGSARGWAHIGVVRALEEAGLYPSVVAGCSIGAVVGACYAADKLDVLEAFARSLTKRRVMGLLDLRLTGAEIVAAGPDAERFAQAALKLPFTGRIVLRAASAADLGAAHPAQEKLKAVSGSAAFVCVGERCSLPVMEPDKIAEAAATMRRT